MIIKLNESNYGYKSGDRYYGGLPSEPSVSDYGNFMKKINREGEH